MSKILRISFLVGILLTGGLGLGFQAASASGMSIDPKYGNYETTFGAEANGFNKNDQVSLWVGLSDGSTVSLGTTQADSSGSISFAFSPQSDWAQGEVIVVARGMSSKHEVSAKFTLVDDASETTSSSSTDGAIVAYAMDGLSITYVGSGYTAGERVAAWFQYPSESGTDTAHALDDVYADASGNVSFTFTIGKDWEFGNYHVTAYGASSQHITYNTFSYFGTITEQREYLSETATGSGTVSSGAWYGYYYDNAELDGSAVYTNSYATLDFDWGLDSPASIVPSDDFSARWITTRAFAAGYYTITATADDGIRVYVDGSIVIDAWQDQSATTFASTVYLDSGNHTVKVEYYEHTLAAVAAVEITAE
ncbi:hypothetical protein FBQ82_15515 [Anaerolineae bacterium CFX7]|nr:hypothetical protein [Anaerolineae bacterium CFX7]RIK33527.1 MAG: hypothetical protein DCC52_03040 [Chloroflexota bacterium]